MGSCRWHGVGLHSGVPCTVKVEPKPVGYGVQFVTPSGAHVHARPEHVLSTERCTTIGAQDQSIATVEHLMAALAAVGLWDARIEVDGPEIPVLDGSALPYVLALRRLGPFGCPTPIELCGPIRIEQGSSVAVARPWPRFFLRLSVSFDHPAVGHQSARWTGDTLAFEKSIAPARTFGFIEEVQALWDRGLAQGGDLTNALVFGATGPLSPMRLPSEPARHKLLDAVGDLALLGAPLRARIELTQPGHSLVFSLVQALRAQCYS